MLVNTEDSRKISSSSYSVYPAYRDYEQGLKRKEKQQPIPIKENVAKESTDSEKICTFLIITRFKAQRSFKLLGIELISF